MYGDCVNSVRTAKNSDVTAHANATFAWADLATERERQDRAEQRLRFCSDGRGLRSKLVPFVKGFSKHPDILAIFKGGFWVFKVLI